MIRRFTYITGHPSAIWHWDTERRLAWWSFPGTRSDNPRSFMVLGDVLDYVAMNRWVELPDPDLEVDIGL